MKNEKTITTETALYVSFFLVALILRLLYLGQAPLLESEARWAFQAWQLSQGESTTISSQVGYLAFTEALFSFIGGTNFLARLWPAFVGSLLVWLPYSFRKELTRIPALILAGGLALDPALIPVSRISGSPMPALVFLLLAVGAFHTKRISWALFFLGLGLISGPAFWIGLLLLALSVLVCRFLKVFEPGTYIKTRMEYFRESPESWVVSSTPALLGLLIISSFFLRNFQGIGAWPGSLLEFFRSWGDSSSLGLGRFLIYFLLNNPLIVLFGIAGFITAWRTDQPFGKMLSIWFVITLGGLLLYPSRQAMDLIWVIIPLWAATAFELDRIFFLARTTWITYALASLVVILTSLNWLTFTGLIYQSAQPNAVFLGLGLLAASLALLILSVTIVTSEWGRAMAWKGLASGAAATLFLFLVASLSLDSYLMEKDPRSIFSDGSGSGQMELLVNSIADASITYTGRPDSIQGAVIADNDALRWALREFEDIDYLISPGSGIEYPFLITKGDGGIQALQDNYRGQDFVLSSSPGWSRILPDNWIKWVAFREGPILNEYLILWIRNDIYSGY
jgi:hypothetical protein